MENDFKQKMEIVLLGSYSWALGYVVPRVMGHHNTTEEHSENTTQGE